MWYDALWCSAALCGALNFSAPVVGCQASAASVAMLVCMHSEGNHFQQQEQQERDAKASSAEFKEIADVLDHLVAKEKLTRELADDILVKLEADKICTVAQLKGLDVAAIKSVGIALGDAQVISDALKADGAGKEQRGQLRSNGKKGKKSAKAAKAAASK